MNNFVRIISKWKVLFLCLALTHAGHSMDMDDEQKSVFKSRLASFEKNSFNSSDSSYGHMTRKETSTLPKPRPQGKTSIHIDTRGNKPVRFAFSAQEGIGENSLAMKMTQTKINISKEERAANLEESRQKSLFYARKIGCVVEETASYKEIQDAITKRKVQQQREKEEREKNRQKSLSYARKIGCAVEETASYKEIQDAITKRKEQQQRERREYEEQERDRRRREYEEQERDRDRRRREYEEQERERERERDRRRREDEEQERAIKKAGLTRTMCGKVVPIPRDGRWPCGCNICIGY